MLEGKSCFSLGHLAGSGRGLEERMKEPWGRFWNLKVDLPAKIMTNEKRDASGTWTQNQGGKPRKLGRNCAAYTTQHPSSPSILLWRALYCSGVHSAQPQGESWLLQAYHDAPPFLPTTGLGMNVWCNSDQWYAGSFSEPFSLLTKRNT